jgi:DNA-binding response OmpR family regulator
MKVLIADDEKTLANMQQEILRSNKIEADIVFDGLSAFEYIINKGYDLIILDIMMPKMNGYEVLRKIREKKIQTPVLMLSAKGEVDDKVKGLDIGADDYLTKPFASAELIARIKALTRRKGEIENDKMQWQDLILNKSNYMLICRGEVRLSNYEFKIMEILLRHKSKIVNKDIFTDKVWDLENNSCYNGIEVYISFLRKKLLAIKSKVEIKSMRGVGYFLEFSK